MTTVETTSKEIYQDRVGIGEYPRHREVLAPNTLVVATLHGCEQYGQQVQARIEASLTSIYASLDQLLIDYEPQGNGADKKSIVVEIPINAWEQFYQAHTRLEKMLAGLAQDFQQQQFTSD